MLQWASVVGQALTGLRVVIGIVLPEVGARWAGEDSERQEWWVRARYLTSIALVLVGTAIQMYASWPT